MRAGPLAATLAPELGGALLALRFGGADLLRPTPAGAWDPLAMASFPLVPYANRIAHARFQFGGQSHQLTRNFGDHPHSIHGVGWQAVWTAGDVASNRATLIHSHSANRAWPWSYRAEQTIGVYPDALSISLTIANVDSCPMPAGLGFHPYFVADEHTRLRFAAKSLWLCRGDLLPDRQRPVETLGDWEAGAPVAGAALIDNYYSGWNCVAKIDRSDGLRLEVTADGAVGLHFYRPPEEHYFCLEPVSHMPDAVNRPDGMATLYPGDQGAIGMTISVRRSDEALPHVEKIA